MVKTAVFSPVRKFRRYSSVHLVLSAPLATCLATPRSQHLQRTRDTGPSSPPRAECVAATSEVWSPGSRTEVSVLRYPARSAWRDKSGSLLSSGSTRASAAVGGSATGGIELTAQVK